MLSNFSRRMTTCFDERVVANTTASRSMSTVLSNTPGDGSASKQMMKGDYTVVDHAMGFVLYF